MFYILNERHSEYSARVHIHPSFISLSLENVFSLKCGEFYELCPICHLAARRTNTDPGGKWLYILKVEYSRYHHKYFHSRIVQKKINKSKRWKTSFLFTNMMSQLVGNRCTPPNQNIIVTTNGKSTPVLCELWHQFCK